MSLYRSREKGFCLESNVGEEEAAGLEAEMSLPSINPSGEAAQNRPNPVE